MASIRQNLKHAVSMRQNMTPAEFKLWRAINHRQMQGFKFRRQEAIEGYIVDFLCYEKRLIVELDRLFA